MKHTRVSVDTLAVRGAKDAHAAVGRLRESLAQHLSAAADTAGSAPSDSYRIGSISLKLPQDASATSIGNAVAKAIADAIRDGRRLR